MANKIQVKRGVEANLPTLDVGEPAFTTDTKKPFIGSDTGNIELATKAQINTLGAEKSDITYVDTKVTAVASGSPKNTFTTLALLQADATANTIDGKKSIYVVTADGNWYYWNGSAWIPGGTYQSTGIADSSVTKKKSAFFGIGKNLFDKDTCIDGKTLSMGSLDTGGNALRSISDYIPVTEGLTYVLNLDVLIDDVIISSDFTVQFANATKDTLIQYLTPTAPFVAPVGAAFMRFSFKTTYKDYVQLEVASVATGRQEYFNALSDEVNISLKSLKNGGLLISAGKGKNLFDKNSCILRYSTSSTDGSISYVASQMISQLIPVTEFFKYTISASTTTQADNIAVNWYDKDLNWLGYSYKGGVGGYTFTAPKGSLYARIRTNSTYTLIQFEQGETATAYEPFIEGYEINPINNKLSLSKNDLYTVPAYWKYKKLTVDGDSITHDQGAYNYWQYILANNLKMSLLSGTFTGSNGTTVYTIGTRGIAGSRIAYGTEQNAIEFCLARRYQYLPNDADLVIIAGGTNDWAHGGVPLGVMADRTDATFYGALHVLCVGLINKYPSKQIVFMTPIKRTTNLDFVNSIGLKLIEFVDAIIDVCGYYGIPVCDMFRTCTLNPAILSQKTLYFDDDTHPNTAGEKIMGNRVTGFIESIRR